jgi:hypothetical protein
MDIVCRDVPFNAYGHNWVYYTGYCQRNLPMSRRNTLLDSIRPFLGESLKNIFCRPKKASIKWNGLLLIAQIIGCFGCRVFTHTIRASRVRTKTIREWFRPSFLPFFYYSHLSIRRTLMIIVIFVSSFCMIEYTLSLSPPASDRPWTQCRSFLRCHPH